MEGAGHDHGGHGMSMASNVTREPPPPSYFYHAEHTSLLFSHIILSVVAWCFVLPIGKCPPQPNEMSALADGSNQAVFLSIAKSRYTPFAHIVFSAVNGASIFVGVLYNANTPDLYENNVHHKIGWAFSFVAGAHSLLAIIRAYAPKPSPARIFTFHQVPYKPTHAYSWSRDSGVGSSEGDASPRASMPSSPGFDDAATLDDNFERVPEPDHYQDAHFSNDEYEDESKGLLGGGKLNRRIAPYVKAVAESKVMKAISILYETVNRLILILGFVLVTTGIVTYGGIFKGHEVFSGLAHFIKGGIFFWYGLLTLGRVMGSFGDFGWSWNMKPTAQMVGKKAANAPTLEFLESFLIFFYGSTNVFLEHLASDDGTWSATDLEHVAVAIMFLGGGLCGMLVESRKIRNVLNSTVTAASSTSEYNGQCGTLEEPRSYGYSLNPMPGLIIMLLGIMMSSHHQTSMVSTMLHSQWGTLFVAAAFARGVTYLLIYLNPPTSYLPSRPPSEIVVAFCFISGGMIFMCSNLSMVEGMENLDLNAMFLFTVLMGLTAFIMAWEIVVLALKGLALQKEQSTHQRALSSASTQA